MRESLLWFGGIAIVAGPPNAQIVRCNKHLWAPICLETTAMNPYPSNSSFNTIGLSFVGAVSFITLLSVLI